MIENRGKKRSIWTDLYETARHHSVTIVNGGAKCPCDGLSKDSFLDGDTDEVASRLMSMVPGISDNPGAVYPAAPAPTATPMHIGRKSTDEV